MSLNQDAPTAFIRQMRTEDVDAVAAIDRISFPTPWSRESYLKDMANPHCHYLVAEQHDDVVAYAGMLVVKEDSHLTTIAVHPLWRGQGVGRKLLEAMIAKALALGAEKMTLEVRVGNEVAQNLYEQYGFVIIARLRHYYLDTGDDALVMILNPLRLSPPEQAIH
jgi:[ribosomal protein S18]-alanine N-acetyltransferase